VPSISQRLVNHGEKMAKREIKLGLAQAGFKLREKNKQKHAYKMLSVP